MRVDIKSTPYWSQVQLSKVMTTEVCLLSCCKNCTLTQVRLFLKKELAKIMQKDSKVNKFFFLFTKKARAKIFQPQKLTPN